jgi:hypothetical protein
VDEEADHVSLVNDNDQSEDISAVQLVKIAQACHEGNRAICQRHGDNSQSSWEDAPEWQKKSAINGVLHVIDALNRGETPKPEDSHNNWLKEKEATGWRYGKVKDVDKKTHPCMVPYEELSVVQRSKDETFIDTVARLYKRGK